MCNLGANNHADRHDQAKLYSQLDINPAKQEKTSCRKNRNGYLIEGPMDEGGP